MILQINVDDGDACKALEIARQRYNMDNANAAGFVGPADVRAFSQILIDQAAAGYTQRYMKAPQNLADALARIAELEARNDALRKELAAPTAPA